MQGAVLDGSLFEMAVLTDVNLREAHAEQTCFSCSHLVNVQGEGVCFTGADFAASTLTSANLEGADLSRTKASDADFTGANLSHANLTGADFMDAFLRECDLGNADLSESILNGADLKDSALVDVDMTGVTMRDSLIQEAKFLRCNLTDADLRGTAINLGNFKDCVWEGIRLDFRLGMPGGDDSAEGESGPGQ
jgi:uncharacterized protein YjbI with pentapeptide repeats